MLQSAGVAATTFLLNKGIRQADNVLTNTIQSIRPAEKMPVRSILPPKTGKVYRFFAKAGEKLFGKNTKIGQAIESYVTSRMQPGGILVKPEEIKAFVTRYKTIGAMALAAGVAGLAFLARGIYKAGKIEGEKA